MQYIFNFSNRPIVEPARGQLETLIGRFDEYQVALHTDPSRPLVEQVEGAVVAVPEVEPSYLVPPADPTAAYLLRAFMRLPAIRLSEDGQLLGIESPPEWYTARQAAERLRLSTPQQISRVARDENWRYRKIGRSHLYEVQDVEKSARVWLRTRLAKKLGWRGRGKVREDGFDIVCPQCGGFAVERVPTEVEDVKAWADAKLKGEPWPWLCERGHKPAPENQDGTIGQS